MRKEKASPITIFLSVTFIVFITIGVVGYMEEQGITFGWRILAALGVACIISGLRLFLEAKLKKRKKVGK